MAKKRTKLGGVVPATITPFTADEQINGEAMLQLMRWNLEQGADSFFIGTAQKTPILCIAGGG